VWTDTAKANWVLEKYETDPRNVGNLSVAIVDIVRRDLDALSYMPDDHFHSSFLRPFFDLVEARFLACNYSRERARARAASRNEMNTDNLVYQVDLFHGGVWHALSQLECEIMMWINVQWLELHNRQVHDGLGVLGPRPDRWWEYTRAWSQQWWETLRRLDCLNEQYTRDYFVSPTLGVVRGISEWNKPYGHV
jgi:hypothetical protein